MARYALNRPMVLEQAAVAADGAGGHSLSWAALGTIWAELRPGAGRERLGPVAPEGARIFTILSVAEADAAGAWLVCLLREEVPA